VIASLPAWHAAPLNSCVACCPAER